MTDKTMLCARCGELVPQGTCTCGDKQELADCGGKSAMFVNLLGEELGRLLDWHDAVRREMRIVPSPHYIDEVKAAYNAWIDWRS